MRNIRLSLLQDCMKRVQRTISTCGTSRAVLLVSMKQVPIKCPKLSGSRYFNYKGFFSVTLQGLVDARYEFLTVGVGAYGRQSDSGVSSQSNLYHHLESGSFPFPHPRQIPGTTTKFPYIIFGDSLKDYLMSPYRTDKAAVCREIEVCNYRHSRARRTVEYAHLAYLFQNGDA